MLLKTKRAFCECYVLVRVKNIDPKISCGLMDPLFSPLLELMLNNGVKNIMSFVEPFGSIEG